MSTPIDEFQFSDPTTSFASTDLMSIDYEQSNSRFHPEQSINQLDSPDIERITAPSVLLSSQNKSYNELYARKKKVNVQLVPVVPIQLPSRSYSYMERPFSNPKETLYRHRPSVYYDNDDQASSEYPTYANATTPKYIASASYESHIISADDNNQDPPYSSAPYMHSGDHIEAPNFSSRRNSNKRYKNPNSHSSREKDEYYNTGPYNHYENSHNTNELEDSGGNNNKKLGSGRPNHHVQNSEGNYRPVSSSSSSSSSEEADLNSVSGDFGQRKPEVGEHEQENRKDNRNRDQQEPTSVTNGETGNNIEDDNNSSTDPSIVRSKGESTGDVDKDDKSMKRRPRRSVVHLYDMVVCATGCNPLAYKGYGCYCGFMGSGITVDGIDK